MKDTITITWTDITGFMLMYTCAGLWLVGKLRRRYWRD